MKVENVSPNMGNFVSSLRDIGYSTRVAVADILDNSIAAHAKNVKIHLVAVAEAVFGVLDDGVGMSSLELVEAMRLATKGPSAAREKTDLGRFGLGLKTASFSQCKKLTVISKKSGEMSARAWDLNFVAEQDQWLLITPETTEIEDLPFYPELVRMNSGTLVVWQEIDSFKPSDIPDIADDLIKHLSLVFHRFLESRAGWNRINIELNGNRLKPFDPFHTKHPATQQLAVEKINIYDGTVQVQPYILPHHSKVSQYEYEQYATDEGYTQSQGFYLYRANRLLIYGTWWGLHRAIDAHKLVRIRVEVPNNQDKYWQIDIKKSSANPSPELRADLKRIIKKTTELGSRPYTGRGRKIEDKRTTRFWGLASIDGEIRFALNYDHPLLVKLQSMMAIQPQILELLNFYLKGVQAYLPLNAIQAQLQQNPHKIDQASFLSVAEIRDMVEKMNTTDFNEEFNAEFIESLLGTELFKGDKELL